MLRKRCDGCGVGADSAAAKRLGRPRETELRAVVDAILYLARTGCQWRMLPKEFPPFPTVQGYFDDWRDDDLVREDQF